MFFPDAPSLSGFRLAGYAWLGFEKLSLAAAVVGDLVEGRMMYSDGGAAIDAAGVVDGAVLWRRSLAQ